MVQINKKHIQIGAGAVFLLGVIAVKFGTGKAKDVLESGAVGQTLIDAAAENTIEAAEDKEAAEKEAISKAMAAMGKKGGLKAQEKARKKKALEAAEKEQQTSNTKQSTEQQEQVKLGS